MTTRLTDGFQVWGGGPPHRRGLTKLFRQICAHLTLMYIWEDQKINSAAHHPHSRSLQPAPVLPREHKCFVQEWFSLWGENEAYRPFFCDKFVQNQALWPLFLQPHKEDIRCNLTNLNLNSTSTFMPGADLQVRILTQHGTGQIEAQFTFWCHVHVHASTGQPSPRLFVPRNTFFKGRMPRYFWPSLLYSLCLVSFAWKNYE